jgi:ketosteroid isomerase-like protein
MPEECTTPDLVELVHRMFEAFRSRDFDGVTSFYAPDAVWESVGLGTSFDGLAAIRRFPEDWRSRYEEYEIEPEEILDLGDGVVFAKSGQAGRPIGSPVTFAWRERSWSTWSYGSREWSRG